MKKVFTLFVCALFLLSIISVVEAQRFAAARPRLSPTQLADLSPEDIEKIRTLGRAALANLENLDPAQIQARLADLRVMRTSKIELFNPRGITEEVAATAKERFEAAKQRMGVAKAAHIAAKQRYDERRAEYRACKNDTTAEGCDEIINRTLEDIRAFALHVANRLSERINKLLERLNAAEDIPQDKYDEIFNELTAIQTELDSLISQIEAAETVEDLKGVLMSLKEIGRDLKHKFAYHASKFALHWANGLMKRANVLSQRMEKIIDNLEQSGELDDHLQELANAFDEKLAAAKDKFHEAVNKMEEARELRISSNTSDEGIREQIKALAEEAKALFKETIGLLKDAHDILKDFMKDARDHLREANVDVGVEGLLDPEETVATEISEEENGGVGIAETEDGLIAPVSATEVT